MPSPEFFKPRPSPTALPDATAASYDARIWSRQASAPPAPSSMIWPGPHSSPGRITLRLRISHPEMPTCSASRSSTPSIANCAWLAPNPRNAPHTRLLVRTAIVSMSSACQRYGPQACPAARSNTFIPTLAYAPESPMPRTFNAVSRPSASQPAQYSSSIGCRLACIRKLSSRDSVHFTGRPSSHAASAVCAWLLMSSLPPNAPPFDTSSTVTRAAVDVEHGGDVVAVVPHALAAGVHVQRATGVAVRRHRDGRLGFEEGMLDALGVERLVHRERTRRERRLELVAACVRAGRQHVRRRCPTPTAAPCRRARRGRRCSGVSTS